VVDIRELIQAKKPIVIGHRGAFSEAPENTMLSFKTAVELGADMIELDVRMCRTGEIVVIHDAEVDRTSNGTGLVREMTLEELKELDFGEGEKIPTLGEVLEFAKDRIPVNIEIKEQDIVEKVVRLVERYGMVNQVIISSFFHNALLEVKKLNPSIITAPLFMHKPVNSANLAIETRSEGLHPYYEVIDEELIQQAHENNFFVNAWTVDYEEVVEKLIKMGIDGVITNDIEMVKDVIENL